MRSRLPNKLKSEFPGQSRHALPLDHQQLWAIRVDLAARRPFPVHAPDSRHEDRHSFVNAGHWCPRSSLDLRCGWADMSRLR